MNYPKSYEEAKALLHQHYIIQIGKGIRLARLNGWGEIIVKYHDLVIVRFYQSGAIILNSGRPFVSPQTDLNVRNLINEFVTGKITEKDGKWFYEGASFSVEFREGMNAAEF